LIVREAGVVGHQEGEEVVEPCYWEYGILEGLMLFDLGI
jgi:hypothetical protein